MDTDTALATVRTIVGRRHIITRADMAAILAALQAQGLDLSNDCLFDASPATWAAMCKDIECISVLASGATPHGAVRYDQPGSMHPLHQAAVLFAAADIDRHEGTLSYLRRHARRVLLVRDDPAPLAGAEAAPAPVPDWVRRLRRAPGIDGTWARVCDDGVLELRDPNSGAGADPADKPRYQFRIGPDGYCERRHLPPASVGDVWCDIGAPEWERHEPPRSGPVWDWIEAQM